LDFSKAALRIFLKLAADPFVWVLTAYGKEPIKKW
jgi:hypothetical protein